MDRRSFFKTTALGAGALAASSLPLGLVTSCTTAPAPKLHLSFQHGTPPGETLAEKLDYMEKLGIEGYEPGGKALLRDFAAIDAELRARNIKLSAICAGFDGFILAEDPAVKAEFDTSMREIVEAAGKLGSPGVIMVPAFNAQTPCKPHTLETRDYLCAELHELGEFALKCGTTVILEPLNRREAFYLRLVGDAAAIARDSESAGVKCMGDFWHMQEEVSDYGAFMSAGKEYLQHVHIASKGDRKMPGEHPEADDYTGGFRALKQMGYEGFVSFECGCGGEREILVPAAVELLREQWAKA